MKIGHFGYSGSHFLGAVFADRVIDLTGAGQNSKEALIHGLTGLFRTGSFSAAFFHSFYEQGKDREGLWHNLEDLSFFPFIGRARSSALVSITRSTLPREEGRHPVEPIYFEKAVSAMIANGEAVICNENLGRIDPEPGARVHHRQEGGKNIGSDGSRVHSRVYDRQ